jgi:predicted transcriptional regulator
MDLERRQDMSLYTTGELAKKCNVSVRTIQYYDERGILVPSHPVPTYMDSIMLRSLSGCD